MDREIDRPIIVASGFWKHVRLVLVRHRHYLQEFRASIQPRPGSKRLAGSRS